MSGDEPPPVEISESGVHYQRKDPGHHQAWIDNGTVGMLVARVGDAVQVTVSRSGATLQREDPTATVSLTTIGLPIAIWREIAGLVT